MSTVVEGARRPPRLARQSVLAYYPGCSLHGTEPEYDESLRAVVEALGIAIAEIPDWNCCGASSGHTTDHLLGVALPARNLALAEAAGFDRVLAPCAACYNRLAAARLAVAEDAALAEQMPDILGRPFANSVDVMSVATLLRDVAPTIAEKAAAPRRPRTPWSGSSSPPTTAACSSARPSWPPATTPSSPCSWTTSSRPAAPRPSTGT